MIKGLPSKKCESRLRMTVIQWPEGYSIELPPISASSGTLLKFSAIFSWFSSLKSSIFKVSCYQFHLLFQISFKKQNKTSHHFCVHLEV